MEVCSGVPWCSTKLIHSRYTDTTYHSTQSTCMEPPREMAIFYHSVSLLWRPLEPTEWGCIGPNEEALSSEFHLLCVRHPPLPSCGQCCICTYAPPPPLLSTALSEIPSAALAPFLQRLRTTNTTTLSATTAAITHRAVHAGELSATHLSCGGISHVVTMHTCSRVLVFM